jgi:hypothetical protein
MSFQTEGDGRTLQRWKLVIAALVGSDVLLALVMWLLAFVVQTQLGRIPLATTPLVSIVEPLVLWLYARHLFGFYSPSHWPDSPQEEFKRNAYSVLAALGVVAIFLFISFTSQLDKDFSRLYVFAFFGGLLVSAPYVRRWVKWRLRRAGVWP